MSTYANPRPQPVRVVLSDGSERLVGPWGFAFLPDSLHMVRAELAIDSHPSKRVKRTGAAATSNRRAA